MQILLILKKIYFKDDVVRYWIFLSSQTDIHYTVNANLLYYLVCLFCWVDAVTVIWPPFPTFSAWKIHIGFHSENFDNRAIAWSNGRQILITIVSLVEENERWNNLIMVYDSICGCFFSYVFLIFCIPVHVIFLMLFYDRIMWYMTGRIHQKTYIVGLLNFSGRRYKHIWENTYSHCLKVYFTYIC